MTIWTVVHAIHLLAMAFFVGGQIMLAAVLVPVLRGRDEMKVVARRFGLGSLVALALLVVTGMQLASHEDAWSDTVLQVKLTLLVILIGLLGYHVHRGEKRWMDPGDRPAVDHDHGARRRPRALAPRRRGADRSNDTGHRLRPGLARPVAGVRLRGGRGLLAERHDRVDSERVAGVRGARSHLSCRRLIPCSCPFWTHVEILQGRCDKGRGL